MDGRISKLASNETSQPSKKSKRPPHKKDGNRKSTTASRRSHDNDYDYLKSFFFLNSTVL